MSLLDLLAGRGLLDPLDLHLARTLAQLGDERRPEVLLAVALASHGLRDGHTCLRLDALADRPLAAPAVDGDQALPALPPLPPLGAWRQALRSSRLCAFRDPASAPRPGGQGSAGAGEGPTGDEDLPLPLGARAGVPPLVLDDQDRLYLRRYYDHEQALAAALRARAAAAPPRPVDEGAARAAIDRLFGPPPAPGAAHDWQRVAAASALLGRLCVIAGGPGTGKTSTVARILALIAELEPGPGGAPPRVLLLAPTGKAAARLVESILQAREGLRASPAVLAALPSEASTIHRALGAWTGGRRRFSRHAEDPLRADLVVVDEASMVDLALGRRLLEAVPAAARLILLGDAHQLASVEAGAVLGELCGASPGTRLSPARAAQVERIAGCALPPAAPAAEASAPPAPPSPPAPPAQTSPIDDAIVHLTRSYRFDAAGGIGALARAILQGDAGAALAVLADEAQPLTVLHPRGDQGVADPRLLAEIVDGYADYLAAADPPEALARLGRFRLLCAHRRGPAGVEAMNRAVERALAERGLLRPTSGHYPGRPVLVTQNDYAVGLLNGDVGVLWRGGRGDELRAWFPGPGGAPRALAPARLPPHETVFAMTIHKSQGSELERVAIVLPDPGSPLLTRELLYTAVTRARARVSLHASVEAIRACVDRPVLRASGLSRALRR